MNPNPWLKKRQKWILSSNKQEKSIKFYKDYIFSLLIYILDGSVQYISYFAFSSFIYCTCVLGYNIIRNNLCRVYHLVLAIELCYIFKLGLKVVIRNSYRCCYQDVCPRLNSYHWPWHTGNSNACACLLCLLFKLSHPTVHLWKLLLLWDVC